MSTGVAALTHSIFVRQEMAKVARIRYVGHADKREIPIFAYGEVAYYFGIPKSTMRSWIMGRNFPKSEGDGFCKPVIQAADPVEGLLSYYNVAEVHVLASARYEHHVSFRSIRSAIEHLNNAYPSKRPLLSRAFYTDVKDLFIKTIAETENLTQQGQLALKTILDLFLARIAYDKNDLPFKVFPLLKGQSPEEKVISMVSGVAASRPTIDGTGVPVTAIWQRHKAGESEYELADDYDIEIPKIRKAIEYVEYLKQAA